MTILIQTLVFKNHMAYLYFILLAEEHELMGCNCVSYPYRQRLPPPKKKSSE